MTFCCVLQDAFRVLRFANQQLVVGIPGISLHLAGGVGGKHGQGVDKLNLVALQPRFVEPLC
jgi:hypothetical protein